MPVWLIILIVVLVLLLVVLPCIIFSYAGKTMVKTMRRDSQGFKNVNMDISFYANGPVKALADEGVK